MTSEQTRNQIQSAHEAGMAVKDIAQRFDVSKKTVYNLLDLAKQTGSMAPRKSQTGRPPALSARQMEELRQLLLAKPTISLRAIIREKSLSISASALCRIIRNKLNFGYVAGRYAPMARMDKTG